MMEQYVLSIDQSTSATKAILFDGCGKLVNRCNAYHRQFYPKPGWVEHDAKEIFDNTLKTIREIIGKSGIALNQIKVLSVTNQRETVVVWDKNTGEPVYRALVWQCRRAEEICKALKQQGYESRVKEKTGLVLSPYFSAAKVKWILDHVEGARRKADQGDLLMGTIDSWLVWNLTGRKVHATDYSNASRTQLFNIKDLKWDEDLLEIFGIPLCMMPQVKPSDEIFGYLDKALGFDEEIPISGIIGDSHAALFGQNCFEKGMAKATYGTGSSIMINIGDTPLDSQNGLVSSVAWGLKDRIDYVFEGNINCTGATIRWLVEELELLKSSKDAAAIASSVESNEGVYIVPAFAGLGAPYWDSEAKAAITGLTHGIKRAHIIRAAEESIAYQIKDVLDLMIKEGNTRLKELRVDGGPTRDGFLMQFQADMLNTAVACASIEELSAMGSCLIAGLAVGMWESLDQILSLRIPGEIYVPMMAKERRLELYQGWKEAVQRTLLKVIKP